MQGKIRKGLLALGAAVVLSFAGLGVAAAATSHAAVTGNPNYCVQFGSGASAAGNVVLYNWDHSACPPGTYGHDVADNDGTGTGTDTDNFLPSAITAADQSSPTSFTITSGASGAAVTYTCHFVVETGATATAASFVIKCTHA